MIDFDREHIWHPYTSMTAPLLAYPVASAEGVRIRLSDGRELIDGMAAWWCMIHGYNHPVLNAAIEDQLKQFAHVMFGGLTHAPAVELAKKLINITPEPLQYVFFSDSGSVAVEVAIKMAMQYWYNIGHADKGKLLTIRGGYHGDTFGAMTVCDPETGMHSMFTPVLTQHYFASRPVSRYGEPLADGDIDSFRTIVETRHAELAAVILEPIVQGAGGMWFYSAAYLAEVAALCREFDLLLILDEIATGFGRSGTLFASEHADVEPDILCLGKAMTGGYLSLAATLCNHKVRDGVSADGGVLMHGPTFMGNPLATAVAGASIDLLLESAWQERVSGIEQQLQAELASYAEHPAVADVRVLGAIGVVETRDPVPLADAQRLFVDQGVWIRPFDNLIYLMPPYIIEPPELSQLTTAIGPALDLL